MQFIPDVPQWYAISIGAIAAIPLLYFLFSLAIRIFHGARRFLLRWGKYPVIRKYRLSLTPLQALALIGYMGGNGACMGIGLDIRKESFASDLMVRFGILASINMVPLFLGGRTNFFADKLGVSYHSYYLAHHWVGRMAVLQGVLHAILAIITHGTRDYLGSSGVMLVITLGCTFIFSIYPVRMLSYEVFLIIHFILAVAIIVALFWHASPFTLMKIIFPAIALFIWSVSNLFRLRRFLYFNFTGRYLRDDQATITKYNKDPNIIKLELQLKRSMHIKPGQYVYLNFPSLNLLQSHPFTVCWWNEETSSTVSTDPGKACCLTFLIEPKKGITRRLMDAKLVASNNAAEMEDVGSNNANKVEGDSNNANKVDGVEIPLASEERLEDVSNLSRVYFDGPYGQDLGLERYETVLLVARGSGLAGILPFAKHLINWKSQKSHRREVITRKLDMYWELEDNHQDEWGGPYLKELQDQNDLLSISAKFLQIWCYFPKRRSTAPCLNIVDGATAGTERSETIYVRNLPLSTSNEDLVNLFTTIGKVEKVDIQYEPSGRSRGTAVIRFDTAENAETAIETFDYKCRDPPSAEVKLPLLFSDIAADSSFNSTATYINYPKNQQYRFLRLSFVKYQGPYQCFYGNSEKVRPLLDALESVASKSIGRTIVVTCGNPHFTERVREATLRQSSWENLVEYVEAEYRPQASGPEADTSYDIELEGLKKTPITEPAMFHRRHLAKDTEASAVF